MTVECPDCGAEWQIYLRRANEPFKARAQVALRHRKIMVLRKEGLSLAEIGRQLDISKPAVHGHVNGRCKCRLHKGTGRSRQYDSSESSENVR